MIYHKLFLSHSQSSVKCINCEIFQKTKKKKKLIYVFYLIALVKTFCYISHRRKRSVTRSFTHRKEHKKN